MTNRFIKSSIWTSPNLNSLTDMAELFFYRLLPLPDDHGCFGADPRVLKGLLFPLKDSWTIPIIGDQLIALEKVEIIMLWATDKRLYGMFYNWDKHQTIRSKFKRKTPEPPEKSNKVDARKLLEDTVINCNQLITIVSSSPSPPLPPPSSLKELPADEPPTELKADPTYRKTLDRLIAEIYRFHKIKLGHAKVGLFYKKAESYGQAIVAVKRALGKIKEKDMDKLVSYVLTELKPESHKYWREVDWEEVKSQNQALDTWLNRECGETIKDVFKKLARK